MLNLPPSYSLLEDDKFLPFYYFIRFLFSCTKLWFKENSSHAKEKSANIFLRISAKAYLLTILEKNFLRKKIKLGGVQYSSSHFASLNPTTVKWQVPSKDFFFADSVWIRYIQAQYFISFIFSPRSTRKTFKHWWSPQTYYCNA